MKKNSEKQRRKEKVKDKKEASRDRVAREERESVFVGLLWDD